MMKQILLALLISILFLQSSQTVHALGNASIRLPSNISAQPGSIIEVPVMVDTDGDPTGGIDVILLFDKNVLELTDITVYPENSGNVFKQFLTAQFNGNPQHTSEIQLINQANTSGIFSFSAIANVFDSFNGVMGENNPLATVSFKVLNNTPTSVNFLFTPGSTTDTNMPNIEGTADLLKQVVNMNVNHNTPATYPEPSDPKLGDVDGNNRVDIFDYNQILTDFGKEESNLASDLDKNGRVDIFDYNTLLTNFGK